MFAWINRCYCWNSGLVVGRHAEFSLVPYSEEQVTDGLLYFHVCVSVAAR